MSASAISSPTIWCASIFSVLHEIVAAEAGAVVKTIGDAVMATFSTPDRALAAALRMREAMTRINAERQNEDLLLKIGIHEGPMPRGDAQQQPGLFRPDGEYGGARAGPWRPRAPSS